MQFDTSALAGATITEANLLLKVNAIKFDGSINLQLPTQDWSEDTVTYGNQPLDSGTVLTVPITTAEIGWRKFIDITSIVQGWADGSIPNYGIRLQTDDDIKIQFDSKESGGVPILLAVTTSGGPLNAPPELSSVGSQTVRVGELLEFNVSATDSDSGTPNLEADNLPGFATAAGFAVTGATGTFTWRPTLADIGSYTDVTFTAYDATDPSIKTKRNDHRNRRTGSGGHT